MISSENLQFLQLKLESWFGKTLNISCHLGRKSLDRHHSSQWQFQIDLQEIHHRFSGNRLSLLGPQQNLDLALDLVDQFNISENEIQLRECWNTDLDLYLHYQITPSAKAV